jgi:hypothetical protein
MNKKLSIIISLILVAILLIGAFLIYNNQKKEENNKVEQEPSLTIEDVSYINILNWLNKQRDFSGLYTVGERCDSQNECFYVPSYRTGFSTMWARSEAYKKDGDPTQLEILESDIDLYSDKNKAELIQNNFWTCYFLNEIAKEEYIKGEYKEKLKNICLENEYEESYGGVEDIQLLRNEISKKIQEIIENKELINSKIVTKKTLATDLLEIPINLRHFFFNASDRIANFELTGNTEATTMGLVDFFQSLYHYENDQENVTSVEGCQTGLSAVEFYKTTNDENYKTLAEIIFEQQSKKMDLESEEDVAVCSLFFDRLYKIDQKEEYLNQKRIALDSLIKNNFNKDSYFYSIFEGNVIKKVNYNGLLAGLLINY